MSAAAQLARQVLAIVDGQVRRREAGSRAGGPWQEATNPNSTMVPVPNGLGQSILVELKNHSHTFRHGQLLGLVSVSMALCGSHNHCFVSHRRSEKAALPVYENHINVAQRGERPPPRSVSKEPTEFIKSSDNVATGGEPAHHHNGTRPRIPVSRSDGDQPHLFEMCKPPNQRVAVIPVIENQINMGASKTVAASIRWSFRFAVLWIRGSIRLDASRRHTRSVSRSRSANDLIMRIARNA